MRKIKWEKIYYIAIIITVVLSFLPLIVIGYYNCPSADDFNYAIKTFQAWNTTHSIGAVVNAAVETSVNFWKGWQGLYISAFLLALQPAIFGGQWYALTGILMILLLAGSTVFFSVYILKGLFGRSFLESATVGFIMSFLIVQFMPSTVEGIYWYNGAVNYGFFFAVLLLYICSLIELQKIQSKMREILIFVLSFFGIFLLEGGNHVTAFMGLVATFLAFVMSFRKSRKKIMMNSLLLLGGILFFLLNVKSPGTLIRATEFEGTLGESRILFTVFRSMWEAIRNVGAWFGFKELVLIILVLPILIDVTRYIRERFDFRFQYPLLVVIASTAWLALMYCPPVYALGGAGADRLINIVYDCFIILLFINAAYLVGWLQNYIEDGFLQNIKITEKKFLQTAAVLTFALLLSSGIKTWAFEAVLELLSGNAEVYKVEYMERENEFLKSSGTDTIVQEFTVKPKMIYFDDITNDVNDWRNVGVADYYGLKSVKLEENHAED